MTKLKKALKPLIPPDLERCQAEVPNGYSFMTLGGVPGRVRCSEKPSCIAYETKPGKDGRMGAMSLCVRCFPICVQHVGADKLRFELIERGK